MLKRFGIGQTETQRFTTQYTECHRES